MISGYKQPFIDIHTRKYLIGVQLKDIASLYDFDEEFRNLFFKYICKIERKLRSMISYHFSEIYGEQQAEYLKASNYNNISKYSDGISKLIQILSYMANKNTDHEYLNYQRNKYHNVPLWVLVNALTFGQMSKMFEFLPQKIQGQICQNFVGIKKNEMIRFLKVLTLYRNLCAHSERLFSYRTHIAIPNMSLHRRMGLKQSGYLETSGLLKYMGFPENWSDIAECKIGKI